MNTAAHLRLRAFRVMLLFSVALTSGILCLGQVKYSGATVKVRGEIVSPQLAGLELQLLFDGVADLYYHVDKKSSCFYITDRNSRLFTLTVPPRGKGVNKDSTDPWRQGALTVLRAVMQDAPSLTGRIESVLPDRYDLTELMREYHDAVARAGEIVYYEAPPPAFRPHIGLFAACNADFMRPGNSGDLEGYEIDVAFYPVAGISFDAIMPRISEKFSLKIDLAAGKRYFYGYYNPTVAPNPMTEIHRELHLHNFLIAGSMKAGYTFGTGYVKPCISGGLCFRAISSDDSRIEADLLYDDIVISDTYTYNTREKTSFGMTVGLGLSIEISDKLSVTTSLDYSELFITRLSGSYRSASLRLGANF